ncbi:MAG: hypothetical protein U1F15_09280 [Burkholderiales bacterium]
MAEPATPDALRRSIVARFAVRAHVTMILMACFAVGLGTTKLLLMAGVETMWFRYAFALFVAYLAFLLGVRIWLRYAGFDRRILPSRRSSLARQQDSVDLPIPDGVGFDGGGGIDLPFRGGGGSSGGGGASGSYEGGPSYSFAGKGSSSSGGSWGGIDLGDDGWVLVLLVALLAAVFGAVAWILYAAPTILADAAFAGMLSAGLVRSTKHIASGGWVASVVGHTWFAFAVVVALAIAFAVVAQSHFPEARTLLDVVRRL